MSVAVVSVVVVIVDIVSVAIVIADIVIVSVIVILDGVIVIRVIVVVAKNLFTLFSVVTAADVEVAIVLCLWLSMLLC